MLAMFHLFLRCMLINYGIRIDVDGNPDNNNHNVENEMYIGVFKIKSENQ